MSSHDSDTEAGARLKLFACITTDGGGNECVAAAFGDRYAAEHWLSGKVRHDCRIAEMQFIVADDAATLAYDVLDAVKRNKPLRELFKREFGL